MVGRQSQLEMARAPDHDYGKEISFRARENDYTMFLCNLQFRVCGSRYAVLP